MATLRAMLELIDLRGVRGDLTPRLPRAGTQFAEDVRRSVAEVLAAVRVRGDEAVREYAVRFDAYDGAFEVPPEWTARALSELDPGLRAALEQAVEQVRWFHEQSRPRDWTQRRGGAVMGVRHEPLRRVGAYVPGGLAPLVSTAIMTVAPARVAGVEEVVLCTPPAPDGRVNPAILAAAAIAGGADRVFRIGGAQAVAALVYGTQTVPRCEKIVGPGNAYVAEAKMQIAQSGVCGIDLLAGTTEVAIIADESANPLAVAADLVAQAEHDPLATCLLITPSQDLIDRVEEALARELAAARHGDRVRAALEGQGRAALVDDLDQAVEVAEQFAAEHLEVQTVDAVAVAARVRVAGAIFVGAHTPVSLGDYCAGPNHTLPTGGTARFAGGLRTDDFLVPVNHVAYDRDELARLAPVVEALGACEDLPAHVRAVRVRLSGP